ncbi:MAG TPA: hypothetical protein VFE52_08455, partial [Devosia sp.]|nr:hypothetical protein [Devosia sp.]
MLFRPSADQNLVAVHAMLDAWNTEADRFRQAAIEARRGETPTSLTVSAAGEAHDGLMSLLEEIDDALAKVEPCSRQFAALLKAQSTATALLESIGNSYDILARYVTEELQPPTRIS